MEWPSAGFDSQVLTAHQLVVWTLSKTDFVATSIITRWGSQFNSFNSLERSRVPLRDWAILPEIQQLAKAKDCPILLPKAIRILRSSGFWEKLKVAIAVIKPVHQHQVRLVPDHRSPAKFGY